MAFRGDFAVSGEEIANNSRVVAHLGMTTPTDDSVFAPPGEVTLVEVSPGLYAPPESVVEVAPGLYAPFSGVRRYDEGLWQVGESWAFRDFCGSCRTMVTYDDSWDGLQAYLDDTVYRPELAPWFSTGIPESGEFGGVWVMKVDGLGPLQISRQVTELVGAGGVAGPHRDTSRKITFNALLMACSNAGLVYGLNWLSSRLRTTTAGTDSTLRYFAAHPGDTLAPPDELVRELHGLVLTRELTVDEVIQPGNKPNRQETVYRVSWEMTALRPYAYLPPVAVDVVWDSVLPTPVNWVHAVDCTVPADCDAMPVLFSKSCVPEVIEAVSDPPPSCGGCMPVCELDTYLYRVPTMTYPLRSHETAVTMTIHNTGNIPLTLQAYWRLCYADEDCGDNRFPLQVSGLPSTARLTLDGISGKQWAHMDGRDRRTVGIVSTPEGAPWRPPLIDRRDCWELVVLAEPGASFEMSLSLADREA